MAKQFTNPDEFRQWKNAFGVFGSPDGQLILQDLMEFCHFLDDTFNMDSHVRALYEGRRQVFLRIIKNLNLTTEEVMKLYRGTWVDRKQLQGQETLNG
jgi:hypothetical protein